MNRRALVALALGVSVSLVSAQVTMKITRAGQNLGEAKVSQRLLPDGGKVVNLLLTLKGPSRTVLVRTESRFDKTGGPVRKFQETTTLGKTDYVRIIATFNSEGASVVTDRSGKRSIQQVPLVAGAPRADKSELWFSRLKPALGGQCRAYVFNLDSMEWELGTTQYVADPDGGHLLLTKRGGKEITTTVDDAGLPICIEDENGLVMARISG